MPVEIRPVLEADLPFIFKSWLVSYQLSPFARNIPRKAYFDFHHRVIERILARGKVTIAHPPGDPDTILGFLVKEQGILHYCYIKFAFRKYRIATALLADVDPNHCQYTHYTRDADYLLSKWQRLTYNPYLL